MKGRNLPAEHLQAIGQIAVNDAGLDQVLEWLIWLLVGPNHVVGSAVTHRLGFQGRTEMLKRLLDAQQADEDLKSRVRSLLTRANRARDRRNGILHSAWIDVSGGFAPLEYRMDGAALKGEGDPVTAESLMNTAKELWACLQEAEALMPSLVRLAGDHE